MVVDTAVGVHLDSRADCIAFENAFNFRRRRGKLVFGCFFWFLCSPVFGVVWGEGSPCYTWYPLLLTVQRTTPSPLCASAALCAVTSLLALAHQLLMVLLLFSFPIALVFIFIIFL